MIRTRNPASRHVKKAELDRKKRPVRINTPQITSIQGRKRAKKNEML
jgi:hypothetical protein